MSKPSYVDLTPDNLADHHLCCALGDPKHEAGVAAKKAWLKRRFKEGLVFRKLDARGKVFIEYTPAETAWRPIVAPGWMVVHCLWVSGRFAGQGHARALLESCIRDTRDRGKAGVVVATAKRKRPFLGDPKFFRHHGFEVVDEAGEFVLLALALHDGDAPEPRFAKAVHSPTSEGNGFVARHTDQCPFNMHWAPAMAEQIRERGFDVDLARLTTKRQAQRVPSPLGTFGLERHGKLITHHLNAPGAVGRMLDRLE